MDKEIQRIGTASLLDYEEDNSDILLIAVNGDRCDQLSQQYYGTPEFWWFIANVNKLSTNHIDAGTQLRIPISLEQAILE
jgi:nucleoid-associated protein YgaU